MVLVRVYRFKRFQDCLALAWLQPEPHVSLPPRPQDVSGDDMDIEHGHSPEEVKARIDGPTRRSYLRDTVYGAIDGAVTTFAIVAGVAGAGLSPTIIIALGLANVLADGFSMAAGNYSGTKAELDNIKRIRKIEERHIEDEPEGERLELRSILAKKGLSGQVLEDATNTIASDKASWINMMLVDEFGISPVDPHPIGAAMATFFAFLTAGMVPLMPLVTPSMSLSMSRWPMKSLSMKKSWKFSWRRHGIFWRAWTNPFYSGAKIHRIAPSSNRCSASCTPSRAGRGWPGCLLLEI